MKKHLLFFIILYPTITFCQHSTARLWNEVLLEAIRNDFARPTVHARNLFHTSAAMYDAWAVFDDNSSTYFLNNSTNRLKCEVEDFVPNEEPRIARDKAISFAAYSLIRQRFSSSPGVFDTFNKADSLMEVLGYDAAIFSTDYSTGSAEALGNFIASCIIQNSFNDGANELNDYENLYYDPVNSPLVVSDPGNPLISDPNRWQPLTLDKFIDQSGNEIPGSTPDFLSPEWGNVKPFSLNSNQITEYEREGDYNVYHDPGAPPYLDSNETSEYYKWGFNLVNVWGAHLDPSDGVMWDISPNSIGNIDSYPDDYGDYDEFYDFINGGDASKGHDLNPYTNRPYEEQIVPRGDYARVLAEFWADGPDSETPPGHWFTILNYVSDHRLLEKRIGGIGEIVSDLEWDVKSYFLLGGTMHDVAISAWSIKGWYDYIRPVSAIRYMCDKGQSTDINMPNYHVEGIPLVDGYVEIVQESDSLAGEDGVNVGKIKLFTWRGPDYIEDEEIDRAGVGWILAENWWPYQRPSFVTPPFAGFVSGHSTYSSAAAVILSSITGSEYFPGGLGEFVAPKNNFLVFENGPSVDIKLQWATYKDAADQCSLSRIWGGIHPPADDIPGRKIGQLIGEQAYEYASSYFEPEIVGIKERRISLYPNPASNSISINGIDFNNTIDIFSLDGSKQYRVNRINKEKIDISELKAGIYLMRIIKDNEVEYTTKFVKD